MSKMMSATIAIMDMAQELVDKLGRDRLQALVDEGIPARAYEYLVRSLLWAPWRGLGEGSPRGA